MSEIIKEYISEDPLERKYTFRDDTGTQVGSITLGEDYLRKTEEHLALERGSTQETADAMFDAMSLESAKLALINHLRDKGRLEEADQMRHREFGAEAIKHATPDAEIATPEWA